VVDHQGSRRDQPGIGCHLCARAQQQDVAGDDVSGGQGDRSAVAQDLHRLVRGSHEVVDHALGLPRGHMSEHAVDDHDGKRGHGVRRTARRQREDRRADQHPDRQARELLREKRQGRRRPLARHDIGTMPDQPAPRLLCPQAAIKADAHADDCLVGRQAKPLVRRRGSGACPAYDAHGDPG
jgi:hypothetical protein